jgi:DNA polymerase-3 subunit chi
MKVEFHTGVSDKLAHACRLLRKTQAAGAEVVVTGDASLLDRLDQALWTFEALAFVPHARLRASGAPGAVHARTPLWLADDPARCPQRGVLVNLGPEMAPAWQEFGRVIEIVDASDTDSVQARQRWRAYNAAAGVELVHHTLGAAS